MVETHQHRIYGFALNLSATPADAEEIAQDAFVRAHRALAGYDADRVRELKVSAWLHRIALNVFRNRARRPRGAAGARLAPAIRSQSHTPTASDRSTCTISDQPSLASPPATARRSSSAT